MKVLVATLREFVFCPQNIKEHRIVSSRGEA